jgi:hypothetical protein
MNPFADLNNIFEDQIRFNERFIAKIVPGKHKIEELNDEERMKVTKEYLLHFIDEQHELLDTFGWKLHEPLKESFLNKNNIKEELIDIFKYWLSVWTAWGFTPKDAVSEYWRKSDLMRLRVHFDEVLRTIKKPLILIDIDRVLADFDRSWALFLMTKTNNIPPSPEEVIKLKHEYKENGMIQNLMVPMEGAAELTDELTRQGYGIIVISARPYPEYKRIYSDTVKWLRGNNIKFDTIHFTDHKQRFAYKLKFEQGKDVRAAIDDDERHIKGYAELEIKTFFVCKDDSKKFLSSTSKVQIVNNLAEIIYYFMVRR